MKPRKRKKWLGTGFVSRLQKVRGKRSQRRFASDLGVFQQNVNRYENGQKPHTDFLVTISVKEGISLDWLLFGRGAMRPRRRK